jgi:hypothetical protein
VDGGHESCPGCARLFVPFTAANTATFFQINYSPAVDLTGTTVTYRMCYFEGDPAETVQLYVQDGGAQGYASQFTGFIAFSAIGSCASGFTTQTLTVMAAGTFLPSAVVALGVKVGTPASGPTTPAVVYIDSITVTPAPTGVATPYTFDTTEAPLMINPYNSPVASSSVTWLGP